MNRSSSSTALTRLLNCFFNCVYITNPQRASVAWAEHVLRYLRLLV
jgi:hypothetical protein